MPASPPISTAGGSGVGMLESLGGRHVARGTDGTVWVVVAEASGVTQYLVSYYYPLGSVSAVREEIDSGAVAYLGISVCVDTDDQPVVAYTRIGATGIDVFRREADVWTAKTGFTATQEAIESHQIMCREDGTFDCVYATYRAGTTESLVFHRENTVDLGGAWAAATTIDSATSTSDDIGRSRRCAAVMDHDGNIHAAYVLRGTSTWPIKYATFDGVSWSSPETIVTPPTNSTAYVAKHLSLAVGATGIPVLAYATQTRESFVGITGVYYTHRTGGTWATPDQVHATVNHSQQMPTVQIDQQGDLQIFWRGDVVVSTLGYDSIYRAHGTVSSLSVERAVNIGGALIQPEVPFSWEPFGHGFTDSGYFLIFGRSGLPPFLQYDLGISWVHEPKCENSVGSAQVADKSGTAQPAANAILFSQVLAFSRLKLAFAENRIDFAQHVFAPFASNRVTFAQTVSVAGSIYLRSAGNSLALSQTAIRESPVSCETDYEPDPPINASDGATLSTSLSGPWPSLMRKIKLPLPQYGDSRGVDLRVMTLRTRHGETFQSIRQETEREFVVSWPQLSRKKAIELRDFLDAMVGRECVWTDVNGQSWRVVAIDPAVRTRRDGIEYGGVVQITLSGVRL